MATAREFNGYYSGENLNKVAFPLGGIGAGMICLEGVGALSHFSLRHRPEVFHEPQFLAAVAVRKKRGRNALVLEGQVPAWKLMFPWPDIGAGNGGNSKTYGLPRFRQARFRARFPFGAVELSDRKFPLSVELTGWSPFVPGDSEGSSLPAAGLEYKLKNISAHALDCIWSFHAANMMDTGSGGARVGAIAGGFTLEQPAAAERPWEEGRVAVQVDFAEAVVDHVWFRGGWFDALTTIWKNVCACNTPANPPAEPNLPSRGGSIYVPLRLEAGEERTVRVRLSWHVPLSNLRLGKDPEAQGQEQGCCCKSGAPAPTLPTYRPWYARRFPTLEAVAEYWGKNYARLREESAAFSDCFYSSDLPPEVLEAVAANLTILKSPTVLRQEDGRLWAWEGCCDGVGCCHGSCTHVWNYAQALPHLFPDLERSLRQTEFHECQDERGHQNFRANLPIRPGDHAFHAAADGQLGGIMKVYREWRISADGEWLKRIWPRVRRSLEYCISTWDPDRLGAVIEPHHNTYDIEFWGPDGMCSGFYLGALKAAARMGKFLGEDVAEWEALLARGVKYLEEKLFNGEYFYQDVRWHDLHAPSPATYVYAPGQGAYGSPEARALLEREGPKYQYGTGCLSDGALGVWMAEVCGLGEILDREKVRSHLAAVYRHNFKKSLYDHANPQRPTYAVGGEGGLLLCSWPRGGRLSLPFVYSEEVWTGIEYQVAAHLALLGLEEESLEVVRAVRRRYDGRARNPFNEYECGHWYARALASYSLLQAFSGCRYDAVDQTLRLSARRGGDWQVFVATAGGYGLAGMRGGQPFLDVKRGRIEVKKFLPE